MKHRDPQWNGKQASWDAIELSEEFTAVDAVETCEDLTAVARDIDVDGYRIMFSEPADAVYGPYGVPRDTIGALRAALAAVELARTLVRRDMGADDRA